MFSSDSEKFPFGSTLKRSKVGDRGVVFSAKQSFNPTNLAIERSLEEAFDAFTEIISGELQAMDPFETE